MFGLLLTQFALASSLSGQSKMFQLTGPSLQAFLESTWRVAHALPGVMTGPEIGPSIIVFFDPNCPFCAHFWHRLHALRKRLRIKWVPVAFIRPTSLNMAAQILASKSPVKALDFNEQHYDFALHEGGLLPSFNKNKNKYNLNYKKYRDMEA